MISLARLQKAIAAPENWDAGLAQDMTDRARVFVERQTHRYFGPKANVTEAARGTGTRQLMLRDNVVGEVVSVIEQEYPGATPTTIAVVSESVTDGYELRHTAEDSVLVRSGGGVWTFDWEYLVTYERGYAIDKGPKDIEALVIGLVGMRFKLIGREGLRSEDIGGYAWTRFGEGDLDALDGAWDTIKAWRRPVFG